MASMRSPAVERYHDRVAHQYDDIYDQPYWRWHDALTWDYIKPHLPKDQHSPVCDLGCGTGKWGLRIARSGYHVTCVDISRKMLDVVCRKIEASNLDRRVDVVKSDLASLSDHLNAQFTLAVAFGEPLCSTTTAKALKEINRVLLPGGVLIATVDNRLHALDHYLRKGDTAALQRFVRDGKTHWLTQDAQERFELQTYAPIQVRRLLEKSKFEVVEMRGKTVLPMRQYQSLLENREDAKRLFALEKKLSRDPDAIGRAGHIQFVARKITKAVDEPTA